MKEKSIYKKNLLKKTAKSMTNITPDEEKILEIEDLRMDFKNLSAKIINLGNDEHYLEESIKAMELTLFWTLKSILVGEKYKNSEADEIESNEDN